VATIQTWHSRKEKCAKELPDPVTNFQTKSFLVNHRKIRVVANWLLISSAGSRWLLLIMTGSAHLSLVVGDKLWSVIPSKEHYLTNLDILILKDASIHRSEKNFLKKFVIIDQGNHFRPTNES
jgi:hypothetical protein